jgi:hypothetical protein
MVFWTLLDQARTLNFSFLFFYDFDKMKDRQTGCFVSDLISIPEFSRWFFFYWKLLKTIKTSKNALEIVKM